MPGKDGKKLLRGAITVDGTRYYVSGYTAKEVERKKEEKRKEIEAQLAGLGIVESNMTVKKWAESWITDYKQSSNNARSLSDINSRLKKWILPVIGNKQLKKVRQKDLNRIMNNVKGQSRSLINKIYDTINDLFKKAEDNNKIIRTPCRGIKKPKAARYKSRRSITEKERKVINEVGLELNGGIFFLIMLHAGLRPSEVAALKWEDIDFDKKEIHVWRAVKSDDILSEDPEDYNGKTENSERIVFLNDFLISALQQHRDRMNSRREKYCNRMKIDFKEVGADEFVAPQLRSIKPIHHTKSSVRSLWETFRIAMHRHMGGQTDKTLLDPNRTVFSKEEIVIDDKVAKDLVPYCLRHTFCTDLRAAGVPIEVAKDLMGHSTIALTAEIYQHAEKVSINKAREKMNKLHTQQ